MGELKLITKDRPYNLQLNSPIRLTKTMYYEFSKAYKKEVKQVNYYYIGDLSKEDAQYLAHYASISNAILEFGMGGSTLVMAQTKKPEAIFHTVEHFQKWIDRTYFNLRALGIHWDVGQYVIKYEDFVKNPVTQKYDFIFVDGHDKRAHFASKVWPNLIVGGVMLFHDGRRDTDANFVCHFVRTHFREIDFVEFNPKNSHMIIIKKKAYQADRDWNVEENREKWQRGYEEPPIDWVQRLKDKGIHG